MIELRNVTKVYNKNKRKECVALKGLSFTLPDKGMVFILGKSGCGKSTLLNLLGGLDSATEGSIIVDGNELSSIATLDGDFFRSSYAGFVFQDFCLLDRLTVAQNVRLSLDLLGIPDNGEVAKRLSDVEIEEHADKYPRELSGGQCQRVAIARALVKSPRLILADEPTGNLDSKTAKQVLDILKELSRKRLVLIVSHNRDDAEKYADRIIELSDGEVVRDIERTSNASAPLLGDKVITLPRGEVLSEDDIAAINKRISKGGVRIAQAESPFKDTKQPTPKHRKKRFERSKSTRHSAPKMVNSMFAKGGYISSTITTIILSVLALTLCFLQSFCFFNSTALLNDAIKQTDTNSFTLNKGYYADNPHGATFKFDRSVPIKDEDISAIYDAGYEGNMYLLYTTPLFFDEKYSPNPLETGQLSTTTVGYTTPYARGGNGVLVTTEDFLKELYGKEGELSLLAGEISDEANNGGIIISDYAADCILYYNSALNADTENKYKRIVDTQYAPRTNISAIFETGYKERYADLISDFEEISQISDADKQRDAVLKITETKMFADFVNEVDKYLGIGYFLGENYHEKVASDPFIQRYARFHNTDVYGDGGAIVSDCGFLYAKSDAMGINQGEAIVGSAIFNSIFGTNYSYASQEGFTPRQITLVGYENGAQKGSTPTYRHTLTIVGLHKVDGAGIVVPPVDYTLLNGNDHYPYAIYFDNADSAVSVYDTASEAGFYTSNLHFKSIYTIKEMVEVFRGVFVYIGIAIALVALMFTVSFALRALYRNRTDIGILRALGCRTSQIALAFIIQVAVLGVVVTFITIAGLPLLTNFVNTVLAENLAVFLENPMLATIEIISISPVATLIVLGILIPVLVISAIVPLIFVRKLKPIDIIRSSDN